ncbi:SLATT domain-containing protein [Providencia hangzhouensis]|uniref:SLATT domain-containing protein n=1 Tax=Providencia hangzhouensis TaxID=3031799 RepID=UPI00288112F0
MGQNSQLEVIEAQIRECFARVAWTHKTQEKCSDLLALRLKRFKWSQIILSALITTGILTAVFGDSKIIGVISAALSLVLTIINTYLKQDDLGGLSQRHADAAVSLWDIREKYLSLLTDIRSRSIDYGSIVEKRDLLQAELFSIYQGSPRTINKAYTLATNALKYNEELTFSDDEIDCLLPKSLRKKDLSK